MAKAAVDPKEAFLGIEPEKVVFNCEVPGVISPTELKLINKTSDVLAFKVTFLA